MNLERARIYPAPTISLVALTFVTIFACSRVFSDWSFFPLLAALGLGVHGVMVLGRLFRLPLLAVTPVAAFVTAAIIGRRMYPDSIRLGLIPTRETWDLAWVDLRDAWRQFPDAVAPVPASSGFLLGAAVAVALVAYTADTFGFRAFGRVEAVIPSGVVFTFVAALSTQDTGAGIDWGRILSGAAWLVTACFSVALLRSAHGDLGSTWLGGRRRDRTIRIAAAAGALSVLTVGVAALVTPRLPGAGEPALIDPGNESGQGVEVLSPIVDIRARLVNRSNRVLFRVEADRASYWHLTSLPVFDGETWQPIGEYDRAEGDLGTEPLAEGSVLEQRFTIDQMGDSWVPAAYEPVAVETSDDLVYDRDSATLRMEGEEELYYGMTYGVRSVLPDFDADELRAATAANPPAPVYLELPDGFPDSLREVAANIVEGADTPFDQARALQQFFRDNFEYDTSVPRGHSESAIEAFLNQRRGYCEQFAGTFAALGRAIGLPTRVAIGFTPGVVEEGRYVVRGRNAHAWPEVWFDGYGWVLFEPTPSRGAPGAEDYTGVGFAQDGNVGADTGGGATPADDDAPTPTASVPRETAPANGGLRADEIPGLGSVPAANTGGASGGGVPTSLIVVTILALLALGWFVVMPRVSAAWIRRRRGHTPAERVTAAWQEATVALGLLGAPRSDTDTPMEHAERAWKTTGIDRNTLRSLATAATRAVYAADTVDEATAHETERIRKDIASRVRDRAPWRVRLRARLNPRTAHALT